MSARKLLALDLSGNVGVARMMRGSVPTFDTIKLEGPDLTFKIGQLLVFLFEEYDRDPFDGLAFEGAIKTDTDTVELLELLIGLCGACYAFIGLMRRREGIHLAWCKVSIEDAKRALTGKARATKDEMVHAARRTMGWTVRTDHEADAGAVGLVGYQRLWPRPKVL